MKLARDLISQFVKATKDTGKPVKESTYYGTTVLNNGEMCVRLDGSDIATPILTTTDIQAGERVLVMIKNHTATITGSTSAPSATSKTVSAVSEKIANVEGNAEEAAKVATNYMELDEDAGLVVGNMTEDVLSKNVKIDSDSVDICDGDTVLASFGASKIDLGATDSVSEIDLCNGAATMRNVSGNFYIEAVNVLHLNSDGSVRIGSPGGMIRMHTYDADFATYQQNGEEIVMGGDSGVIAIKTHTSDASTSILSDNGDIALNASNSVVLTVGSNTYKPYYTAGDVIDMYWDGAGFITSSSKKILFSVPLAKPLLGNPTVTVTSTDGLRVRQGNKYLYGSSDSSYATVSSYEASGSNSGDNFVRISATMPNTTNVVSNNDTCGISAHIRLTLS